MLYEFSMNISDFHISLLVLSTNLSDDFFYTFSSFRIFPVFPAGLLQLGC